MAIATRPELRPATPPMPTERPANPRFSSGPCAKRPGWTLEALSGALLGRSHRAKDPKARLAEVIERSRAILGLPIPAIASRPAASAVILADRASDRYSFAGVAEAMAAGADIRLFSKPSTLPSRRMGVALATGHDIDEAIAKAKAAAAKVSIKYVA